MADLNRSPEVKPSLALYSLLLVLCGCSSPMAFQFEDRPVQVSRMDRFDLGYFLTHCEIVAESRLPHEVPKTHRLHYRILGATEQGNFVHGGPRSIVFVTVWNYADHRDGSIRCYRIEGTRFWEFVGVTEWKGEESDGYFLSFRLASRPDIEVKDIYEVRVGFEHAWIRKVETTKW